MDKVEKEKTNPRTKQEEKKEDSKKSSSGEVLTKRALTEKRKSKEKKRLVRRRSERRHKQKSSKGIDTKYLEEFENILQQWYNSSKNGIGKKDPRVSADLAGKALINFLAENNLREKAKDLLYYEAAKATHQIVSDEIVKAKKRVVNSKQSLHSFSSISHLIRQFIQTFIVYYHNLAAEQPINLATTNDNIIDSQIKTVLESIEDDIGWTLDEENDIYKSLPIRGEFPPPNYRTTSFEEKEKLLPEFARPAEERLAFLTALLKRLEGELIFRSSFVQVPDVDLSKFMSSGNNEFKIPLSDYLSQEYAKIFSVDWRGGNLFAATRSALCFLLHAQTTLDLLSGLPLFRGLVSPTRTTITTRHVLDLPINLYHASEYQSNTTTVKPNLEYAKKRSELFTVDETKTISDIPKAIENSQKKLRTLNPRSDLVYAFTAMFFDKPFEKFKSIFEKNSLSLQTVQPSFFVSSLNFAPYFLHQDGDFLTEYYARNPTSEYSQRFLSSILQPLSKKDEKIDFSEHINKNSNGVIFTKVGKDSVVPVHLSPHKYTESANLFSGLMGEISHNFLESTHNSNLLDQNEKCELLSFLMRLKAGPDNLNNINETSINYVNRRNISNGIFEMLRSTLRAINAYARSFYQSSEITNHIGELTERYTSLLLGYSRAYTYVGRPKHLMFLDIDLIIPFLYRHRNAILDPGKYKQPILCLEYEFYKSPLVQVVFELSRQKPKEGGVFVDALSVITQLYSLWEASKLDRYATHDLNNFIIKLLAPSRYDQDQVFNLMKNATESVETNYNVWLKYEKQVAAYEAFLLAHDTILGDPNVTVPENLCPNISPVNEAIVDVDDAQLPPIII